MDIKRLIKDLTWFNLVEKLKKILNQLAASAFVDAPIDGNQYARQDGDWELITPPTVEGTKIYSGYFTQSGTNDPVLYLFDDMGVQIPVTMYRQVAGIYQITGFPANAYKMNPIAQDYSGFSPVPHFFSMTTTPETSETCSLQIAIRNAALGYVDLLGSGVYLTIIVRP